MRYMVYLLAMLCFYTSYSQTVDTINLYFQPGIYQLSVMQKHTIDSLMYADVLAPGRHVGIIGYADNTGEESNNKTLSEQRANAVASYLNNMKIDSQYIEQVTGVGEVKRAEKTGGYAEDRRVAIIPGGFRQRIVSKYGKTVRNVISGTPDSPVIDVSNVEVNSTFRLENLYFQFGKYELLKQSFPILRALAKVMRENPAVKIQVEGHVCCTDPRKTDKVTNAFIKYTNDTSKTPGVASDADLSSYRAYAVRNFLVFEGHIESNRIRCVGYGSTRKIADPEVTEADKAKNRRVEIRVLAK